VKTEDETREARNKDIERADRRGAWPAQVREAVVRSVMDKGLSTFAVAHQLGVPYTTAVMWVKAYRERGEEALKVKKPALHPNLKKPADERAKAVLATHDAQPHAGSRRIRDGMRRFLGIGASETTVRRVLRAKGVKTQASPRRVRRKQEVQHFERAEPNQLWQSDLFTFLLRRHERIYVAAFLDDHSAELNVKLTPWRIPKLTHPHPLVTVDVYSLEEAPDVELRGRYGDQDFASTGSFDTGDCPTDRGVAQHGAPASEGRERSDLWAASSAAGQARGASRVHSRAS
jgi:transposase